MIRRFPKILFFINGPVPTDEDYEQADLLGPNVAFRNAHFIPAEGCLEECDFVAGAVPDRYAEKYPAAEAEGAESDAQSTKKGKVKQAPAQSAEAPAIAPAAPGTVADVQWKPNA